MKKILFSIFTILSFFLLILFSSNIVQASNDNPECGEYTNFIDCISYSCWCSFNFNTGLCYYDFECDTPDYCGKDGSQSFCDLCMSPGACELNECYWDYMGNEGCMEDPLPTKECYIDNDNDHYPYLYGYSAYFIIQTSGNDCSLPCEDLAMPACVFAPNELCIPSEDSYCNGVVNCRGFNSGSCPAPFCELHNFLPDNICTGMVECSSLSLELCESGGCVEEFNCDGDFSCSLFQTTDGCLASAPPQCYNLNGACTSSTPVNCDIYTSNPTRCGLTDGCIVNYTCVNPPTGYPRCSKFEYEQMCELYDNCDWDENPSSPQDVCVPTDAGEDCSQLSPGQCTNFRPYCTLYGDCESVEVDNNYVLSDTLVSTIDHDCEDLDPAIHVGVTEICGDGLDNNCVYASDCDDPDCESQWNTIPYCNEYCPSFNTLGNYFEIRNASDAVIARIDNQGTMWIKGAKKPFTTTGMTGHDFVIRNAQDQVVLWIKGSTGDLYSSTLHENVISSPSSSGNFVITNNANVAKAWFTATGEVNLKSCLGENKIFCSGPDCYESQSAGGGNNLN